MALLASPASHIEGERERMKEVKVRECGGWTSNTYVKKNKDTSCNCCKWGGEGPGRQMIGAMKVMYSISLIRTVAVNHPI
jgi:hypothetical protein